MESASPENYQHYNAALRANANALRKNMTKAEACLWKYALRAGQMCGYTFRRQRPVLNYIADFMCQPLLLVIEVDGYSHHFEEVARKDERKTIDLEAAGFTVVRFRDEEVLQHMEGVIIHLEQVVLDLELKLGQQRPRRMR